MSGPAAISGDYVDLKFIKTRKVCQMVIEVPIELGPQIVTAFGTPQPDSNVPVAIARLTSKPTTPAPDTEPERRRFSEMQPSQQSALRCNNEAFRAFLKDTGGYATSTPDDAAKAVRDICMVTSRATFDRDQVAAGRWWQLNDQFLAWMEAP